MAGIDLSSVPDVSAAFAAEKAAPPSSPEQPKDLSDPNAIPSIEPSHPSTTADTSPTSKLPPEVNNVNAHANAVEGLPPASTGEQPAQVESQQQIETPTKTPESSSNETLEAQSSQGTAEATTGSTENPKKLRETQELEDKVKDRTATEADIKRLRELKQDPEQKRRDLEQKALDGTITDDEAKQLGEMNTSQNSESPTPEQQAEKLQKDIDELGTELMTKLAKGETITPQDLERLRNLRGQEQLMQQGFTPEQARAAIDKAISGKYGNEKQKRLMDDVREKVQELMAIELQMLSIPKTVDALRAQRDRVKKEAKKRMTKQREHLKKID